MAHQDWREIVPVAAELFVPDVAAAVDFYSERLGFVTQRLEPSGAPGPHTMFALLVLGKAVLMLAHDSLYMPARPVNGPRGLAIDVRIVLDDVDGMYRRCRENAVAVVHDIGDRYYGLRDFIIVDPNGFRLRFASPLA